MTSVSVSNPSAVPNHGGGSRYEDHLIGQIAKKDELNLRLGIVRMRREMILRMVNSLPPRQRTVIERFYITGVKGHAADDIMEWLSVEKSQVYRIKDAALDSIYRMMTDGFGEDASYKAE